MALPHPPWGHHQTRWQGLSRCLERFRQFTDGMLEAFASGKTPVLDHMIAIPTKTQLSNSFGNPWKTDYFKGKPKSLNFYFLVIWWGIMENGGKPKTLGMEGPLFV